MSAGKWVHGKAVVDRQVKFLSASSLQKGDASTSTGCLRAWHYQYIGGIKEPQSDAMREGIEIHEEIEKYLKTGQRGHLSNRVISGMHMIPDPGDDLFVEHSMVPENEKGVEDLRLAPIRIVDTPILGKIDVMHARGINKGGDDVEATRDPDGTVEVIDWKTTSNISNAKAASELVDTIQMSLYGKYVFAVAPDAKLVRLSHGVFPKRGQPRKVTALVDQEAIERSWKRTYAVGVSIRDAAREANPDLVDANTRACRAYGRDCPAMSVCRAVQHNSLASLVGSAADRLVPRRLPIVGEQHEMTTPIAPNNLFARLQAAKNGQAAPAEAPPAPATPAPAPASTPAAPDVEAEIARLTAIEQAATGAPADASVPAAAATSTHPLLALIAEIESFGFGCPQFTGQAARDVSAARGTDMHTPVLAGTGRMKDHAIDDVSVLPTILAGVKELAELEAKNPTTEQPTEQPAEQPKQPAEQPKRKPGRPPKKKTEKTEAEHATATVASGDATSTNIVQTAAPETAPTASVIHVIDPTPMHVIDYGQHAAPPITTTITSTGSSITVSGEPATGPTPQPPGAINVYVDVVTENLNATSLWPLVHYIQENMNLDAAPSPERVSDFRCSDPDGRYGFGKWRGILAACLRDCPSKGLMPPGNYRLDSSMGEIGGVVVETMRQIALATGGVFVKGAR